MGGGGGGGGGGGRGLTYHFVLCFPYTPRGKRLACMHAVPNCI